MESSKSRIKFEDRYIAFVIIGVGICLFFVSFQAAYFFLTERYNIETAISLLEPTLKLGFLSLMILIASLITKRGIDFYGKTRQNL